MPSPLTRGPAPRRILAIDTCLAACQAAIGLDRDVCDTLSEPMTRGHQERLGMMVRMLMTNSQIALADLDLVAVTVGPGSFTGLRVGIAFAKGLALALGRPCVGFGTLEALAASAPETGGKVAAIDGGRGRIFMQAFWGLEALTPPELLDLEAAEARLCEIFPSEAAVLSGPGAALLADIWPRARLTALAFPNIAAVARLARAARGGAPTPLYLRPADATPKTRAVG